jgi:hypothetical protein
MSDDHTHEHATGPVAPVSPKPATPPAPARPSSMKDPRWSPPGWFKTLGVVLGMTGSGFAGVQGGSAVVELRIETLESDVANLETKNQELTAAMAEIKEANEEKVGEVICHISQVHGRAYPGCQIVTP